jgi:hypothetical protein
MEGVDAIVLALVAWGLVLAGLAIARAWGPRALGYAAFAAALAAIALVATGWARADEPTAPAGCEPAAADLNEAREIHVWWVGRYNEGLVEPDDGRTAGDRAWHVRWVEAYDRALDVLAIACPEEEQ